MRIVWTPQAEQDRAKIWTYIAQRNPDAAARLDRLFSDHVARLADFPMIGHEGDIAGTRELTPHRNYRLVMNWPTTRSGFWRWSMPPANGRRFFLDVHA